ncbi:FAD-binding protein [Ferrimicrobium sp.]|uniref:FAD-binding protein n=1 Tax=Ferrimicrobium sp. TaxID=2926050 RepID=UPI002629D0D9|nr:FAD-binding protein [Ferrimicrobium sp.]
MIAPRILVAIKQVTQADFVEFDSTGRMIRHPKEQGLNPFCRRAIATGVALANQYEGTCSVVSMGPPSTIQILREALAVGANDAYLLSDPDFAGADTLATAEILYRFIQTRSNPYDLVLTGRFAIDANTGLVGVQLAELLGLPYAGAAKELAVRGNSLLMSTELDDGVRSVRVTLPTVIAVAERICAPAKASADEIEAIPAELIQRLGRDELGFMEGAPASRTRVDRITHSSSQRLNIVIDGTTELARAFEFLGDRFPQAARPPIDYSDQNVSLEHVAYLCDPDQPELNQQLVAYLLATCATNDTRLSVFICGSDAQPASRDFPGANDLIYLEGSRLEDDLVPVIASWLQTHPQQLLAAPTTSFGREIGGRLGVILDAGVLTDLNRISISEPPTVAGWKSVGSVASTAQVSVKTTMGIVLLRPQGAIPVDVPTGTPPTGTPPTKIRLTIPERRRVSLTDTPQTQNVFHFANASLVLAVGAGVANDELAHVYELAATVEAELGCTRKIADRGIMPRSRQIGITGRSVSPQLYIGIATRGSHNHLSGVSEAATLVNLTQVPPTSEPGVDLTIVGDWHQTLPQIVAYLKILMEEKTPTPPRV